PRTFIERVADRHESEMDGVEINHAFIVRQKHFITEMLFCYDALPASRAWHKELLIQMSESTDKRPAVLSAAMVQTLSEYLAFRHLFVAHRLH
ncbi:MAG: hypothetical protein ACKV2U_28780, partial [Bryobacteraceae bacterium]